MDPILLKSLLFSSLFQLYSNNFFLNEACTDEKLSEDLPLIQKHFSESSLEYNVLTKAIHETRKNKQSHINITESLRTDTYFQDQFSKQQ